MKLYFYNRNLKEFEIKLREGTSILLKDGEPLENTTSIRIAVDDKRHGILLEYHRKDGDKDIEFYPMTNVISYRVMGMRSKVE